MKQILVLGAGLVARPLVRYLLEETDIHVTVASRTVSKAEKLIADHPTGTAKSLDVSDEVLLHAEIDSADIVISLLPWIHHMKVANICVELGRNLVTTSYVKPEMQALDEAVKEKGLIFLNEIGVDPGIDHMAAMNIIDTVHAEGGSIGSFLSYCGGLPALANNNNPFGYKFSWSPVGVMLAATNSGKYLKDGEIIDVPGSKLFEHYWMLDVPGAGTFEAYVNRDALPYTDVYGIPETKSMYRGTLRNTGHCESWNYYKNAGLLNQQKKFDSGAVTPSQALAAVTGSDAGNPVAGLAAVMNVPEHSITLKKLEWLGFFEAGPLDIGEATVFDMFAHMLENRLTYGPGEVDLLVQHHEFIATLPGNKRKKITSTMVDLGIPDGDSSMARTVSLPAAIATKLILNGQIKLTGVHIPVAKEIYKPVLEELETMDIKLIDREFEL